jgi:hypothetical protein
MAIESMENWKILKILLSSRGVTLAKMNQSHRNANWNCNSLLKSNKLGFNATAAKMAKKSLENWKILKITPAKMYQSHWNLNWNLLQSNKPSFSVIATKMAKKKVQKTEKFLKFF